MYGNWTITKTGWITKSIKSKDYYIVVGSFMVTL